MQVRCAHRSGRAQVPITARECSQADVHVLSRLSGTWSCLKILFPRISSSFPGRQAPCFNRLCL